MQVLHYGFWAEWVNQQRVTFDGPNRLMLVNEGVEAIDVEIDLYSDWKEWASLFDHGKFLPAMRAVGGDPTTGGQALGATYFLMNGWRIRTWEGDHRLTVTGNLFTEEGEPPFIPVTGPFTTIIESNVSNLIDRLTPLELIPSLAQDTAQEVWASSEADVMKIAAKILQNKTITNPETGQMVVYDDDGVTPLLVANLYEDADAAQLYRGQGAERRERLE